MAKASAPMCNGSRNLNLLVLLSCLEFMLPTDADSLCYSFTVGKSGSGPWWHQVQGQLNTETVIYCDSSNTCQANGILGNRLKATKTWETQADTLRDGVDLFKQQMVYMKQENNTIREPLTLQARMCCGHEVDGEFNGSWDFDLNGHKMFHVDSITGKWTEVEPGSRWMKEMWENNRDVTIFLKMTSRGDCRSWLEEIKPHWEEKLEPTASPIAPDVDQASSMAIKPNISVLLIILPYSILLWFLRRICDHEGTEGSVGSGVRDRKKE
ncbi:UL16-binding protein 1-like isoform X1 [Peromyscus maniculatus bairdii]|uniref:UL16-binding protein 1-like isoform X1 n=2 Tax=Peromyscus maniculatus bairdii TaxID=230844 RepID=UPI001C2E6244|nr:UL16-binding protein 1-like isoform X1 [Peromyscus maniculatus bairdii]